MRREIIRVVIISSAFLAVFIPFWLGSQGVAWTWRLALLYDMFPVLGIVAFSLLWLHVAGAGLENWLKKYVDFEWFVEVTSLPILILMLAHPLFLLITFKFSVENIFASYSSLGLVLGITGLILLLTYDVGRMFRQREFFKRNWEKILFISTVGFIIIFFHSLELGSNLQSGPLRTIWMIYGITGIVSAIYVYIFKNLNKLLSSLFTKV